VVDPGPEGALFDDCVRRYAPQLENALLTKKYPQLFPYDASGKPATDHTAKLLDMTMDPSQVPAAFASIREFEVVRAEGEGKFTLNRYLRERGDANITSNADLIAKSRFYEDPHFPDRKAARIAAEQAQDVDTSERLQRRFSVQQIMLQCMQLQNLDAVVYPTSNLPVPKLGAPAEPTLHGRGQGGVWTFLGQQGFPAITVPAGYTTVVYDRVENPDDPKNPKLVGPIPTVLPVGLDVLGRPFSEPVLFRIASAYEAATHHRVPPKDFGAVTP
jgi:Asp-tRNA(Asn)/Glu-tRNA(Gln) amidotransferase A subunit family amidase